MKLPAIDEHRSNPFGTNKKKLKKFINKTETIDCSDQSLNGTSKREQEVARRVKISERLTRDQKIREEKPRSLSNHVVSRFYRSPEVIILEKNYDQKVDMWSLGCMFAELLWCCETKTQQKPVTKTRILFPGDSCYPLSPQNPGASDSSDDGEIDLSSKDQLKVICRTLGTPSEMDRSFLASEK